MSEQRNRWTQFSIKSVLILMLLASSYFAGRYPAEQRAREAEQQMRLEAERAIMSEMQARQMAERAMQQADLARQQLSQAHQQASTQ